MLSLYVMPVRGTGVEPDSIRPKYATQLAALNWRLIDYRGGALCLVGVQDVPPNIDAGLLAQPDVQRIPTVLDVAIGSPRLAAIVTAVRQIKAIVEGLAEA